MKIFESKKCIILVLAYVIFGLSMSLLFDFLISTHIYTLSILSIFLGFIIIASIFKLFLLIQKKKHI